MRGQMPKARQRTFDGECGEKKKKTHKCAKCQHSAAMMTCRDGWQSKHLRKTKTILQKQSPKAEKQNGTQHTEMAAKTLAIQLR